MLRVCILGHSYVRDLERLHFREGVFDNGDIFEVKYIALSGSCFKHWTSNNAQNLNPVVNYRPHYIIVCLGGNYILTTNTRRDLRYFALTFFDTLRSRCPVATIFVVQIERRYPTIPNRWNTPDYTEYEKRRRHFNNFLPRIRNKDWVIYVQGEGRLDSPQYYRDGVHLNRKGLLKYLSCIIETIKWVYNGKRVEE